MSRTCLAVLVAAALLVGCAAMPGATEYSCDNGKAVQVAYAEGGTAQLVLDGRRYALRQAMSASGARYVTDAGPRPGTALEWWTKGPAAMLREGPAGQADDPGAFRQVAGCTSR